MAPIDRRICGVFLYGLFLAPCGAAVLLTGCGGSTAPVPPLAGNTSVTLTLSSETNGFPISLNTGIATLSLTNQAGDIVNVLTAPQTVEAIHAQASPSPLFTVQIPQGVYTSAQISDSYVEWTYFEFADSTFEMFTNDINGDCCAYAPSVTLPAPITISGAAMTLNLDLQASDSIFATGSTVVPYGLASKYVLTAGALPATLPAGATSQVQDLYGRVISASADSVSIKTTDGATLTVSATTDTSFQGVPNLAALSADEFLVVDGNIQSDGSLQATRVQVTDTSTPNMIISPVLFAFDQASAFYVVLGQTLGDDPLLQSAAGAEAFTFGPSTTFAISSRFTNLASLPFTATFSATNMAPGQRVWASVPAVTTGNPFETATTVTLVPQTLNGTVQAVNTVGDFTEYTVLLAQEDYVSQAIAGSNPMATGGSPATIKIYVDSKTLSTIPEPVIGTLARFNGLLFNDAGTMRMDCGQILSGASELPPAPLPSAVVTSQMWQHRDTWAIPSRN